MVNIKIQKGYDIPLSGFPVGELQQWKTNGRVALDLSSFDFIQIELLKRVGDEVKIGEALAVDKKLPGRHFVSPASGTLIEIQRGEKRRPLFMVIEEKGELYVEHKETDILERWMAGGGFTHIRSRPGLRLAHPSKLPRSIFVKALETAPFAPPSVMQVQGREEWFQAGITALSKYAPVHLIARPGTFQSIQGAHYHTIEGAHPSGNPSVHISMIDPIRSMNDEIWTLGVQDVIVLGRLAKEGMYERNRVVSFAGEGMKERGYYQVPAGFDLGKVPYEGRLVSGDPLMGKELPFLNFFHTGVTAIPSPPLEREWFHFVGFRYPRVTTHQHGEERPFVDGAIYDRVMPLKISTMHLIKALMNQDFEKAMELGLLEVASEDFALPTFLCPSKIEMTSVVHEKLREFSLQYLS
ncbi:MAG: NADH:ubiquinone reductase (Na(+)-transporting) subunit A [Simkaniaceae bacterium]|nr:NADH:ubiquinone reductase (Na(+)-transporting) subunit A [Simkaniaceae bacterium]